MISSCFVSTEITSFQEGGNVVYDYNCTNAHACVCFNQSNMKYLVTVYAGLPRHITLGSMPRKPSVNPYPAVNPV